MKRIAILGSTGSIGQSALAVVDAHPRSSAGRRPRRRRERRASCRADRALPAAHRGDGDRARPIDSADGRSVRRRRRWPGPGATGSWRSRRTLTSISCCAPRPAPTALEAVLAAIEHGKTIALANKEVLVMAGGIVTEAARRARRGDPAGRQRAQRHPPVPARPQPRRDRAARADRVGRTVPRPLGV